MKRTILVFTCLALFQAYNRAQTVTDYDGNVYDTIMIGNRSWLMQNLKTTHYKNGVAIPNVPGGSAWASLTSGARCYYDNDSSLYDSVYGALYNWYAVNNANGICPDGWHVPTNNEWIDAENFLGGADVAGGKMKEEGTLHWLPPNAGATNSSRFTGLPGGGILGAYTFQYLHENGLWWTSTPTIGAAAWSLYFWYMFPGADHNPTPKTFAQSIRCIKDVGVGIGGDLHPSFRIYPNPAEEWITIELPGREAATLIIYAASGRAVMQIQITSATNKVDITSLGAGIYIAELTGDFPAIRQKLIRR